MSGESRYLSVVLFFIVQTKKKKIWQKGRHKKEEVGTQNKRERYGPSQRLKKQRCGEGKARPSTTEVGALTTTHFVNHKKTKPNQTKNSNLSFSLLVLPLRPKCLALTDFWVPADLTPSGSLSFFANSLWDPPKIFTKKKKKSRKKKKN